MRPHTTCHFSAVAQAAAGAGAAAVPEVTPEALAQLLHAKAPGLLVLDVRFTEELKSGVINGSFNVPTPVFKQPGLADLDRAIHERIKHAKQVVVHCVLCSPGKRGPTAAAALQQRLSQLGLPGPGPQVLVLAGGIDAFMKQYQGDAALTRVPEGGWKLSAH